MTYIGCVVQQGHAQPVDAEVKFLMPTTKKVDAFSWPWLLSAGIMVGHLADLLQRNIRFFLSSVCQRAFQLVNGLLCSLPFLAALNVVVPFLVLFLSRLLSLFLGAPVADVGVGTKEIRLLMVSQCHICVN